MIVNFIDDDLGAHGATGKQQGINKGGGAHDPQPTRPARGISREYMAGEHNPTDANREVKANLRDR
jgi:hypothetical protein